VPLLDGRVTVSVVVAVWPAGIDRVVLFRVLPLLSMMLTWTAPVAFPVFATATTIFLLRACRASYACVV